jgi:hypothetical protein
VSAVELKHPGALTLRRLRAGEAVEEATRAHVAACARCTTALGALDAEQAQFELELPFERFAAGVERAARQASRPAPGQRWRAPALALAAGLLVIAGAQLVLARVEPEMAHGTRLKGGAQLEVIVAGAGAQRRASSAPSVPEVLAPGERVRVGLTAAPFRYCLVVSIDERGALTPIYADGARSLALPAGEGTTWLPDSLEFTGAGLERVVVVLSATPLTVEQVGAALREAYQTAGGALTRLGELNLPGAQFHRTFLKP